MVLVKIKWNKQVFPTEVSAEDTPETLMKRLQEVTGVPPERQILVGLKQGALRLHSAGTLFAHGLREGSTIMLLGTAKVGDAATAPKAAFEERGGRGSNDLGRLGDAKGPGSLSAVRRTPWPREPRKHVPELREYLRSLASQGSGPTGVATTADPSVRLVTALSALSEAIQPRTNERGVDDIPERFYPNFFLASLRSAYPQFAQRDNHGLYMQQDAEECLSQILGVLARMPPSTESPAQSNWIDATFGTMVASTDRCIDTSASVGEIAPVTSFECLRLLPCHISKQVNQLTEGVHQGLEGSIDRYVEAAGRTLSWKRESRIQQLPPYLIVHFVRFFWKPVEKVKAKILRKVAFPLTLDMLPFCTEELQSRIRARRASASTVKSDRCDQATNSAGQSETNGKEDAPSALYDLFAVLTHQGRTADSGHYVAWVRDLDQSMDRSIWLKYDDDRIETVDEEQIMRLCGGGDWHMAYICFYKMRPSPELEENHAATP
ncbi:Ubiquitin carboxyl-terminal hydrolase 14 [Cyanidiococcus yangmingshanensis]|uniref:ubiquitinyl hydrolase 1 n=1 Tax=Cyanidiococcus yangmingshanensis TaxID=2690220 RepID=A0A7J7IQ05_9RHOD|nr:Ubiquitin carboxyl-terminal hydrolase 14 [Cyanidiococcus yangmingshanensis]